LKTPWRDGTTHVVLDPLDFIARLAALVPPLRRHLTRYHGVRVLRHVDAQGARRFDAADDPEPNGERHCACTPDCLATGDGSRGFTAGAAAGTGRADPGNGETPAIPERVSALRCKRDCKSRKGCYTFSG
jgi:hypothetical protein